MRWTDAEITERMADAVGFSVEHVETGGLPFVGVLLAGNGYASEPGVNLVHETGDPCAHAEIVAMRSAMRDLGRAELTGTWLLASGEPCGLCYRFAIDHRVERVYVAADADTVAAWGFDYRASYPAFGIDRAQLTDIIHHLPVPHGLRPFERYLNLRRSSRYTRRYTTPLSPLDTKGTP